MALWQWAINTRGKEEEKTSSLWLAKLLRNSCTTDLRELIALQYNNLQPEIKGGVVYAWLLYRRLFSLNQDTAAALKKFLKLCAIKGLCRIKDENVTTYNREMLAVVAVVPAVGSVDLAWACVGVCVCVRAYVLGANGKPSTWSPPGRLVEHNQHPHGHVTNQNCTTEKKTKRNQP